MSYNRLAFKRAAFAEYSEFLTVYWDARKAAATMIATTNGFDFAVR